MRAILDGVRVVDLTRLLPGPFCTQLLGNLGAEVIKVEDPGVGDYMRFVPPALDDTSYPFAMVNRNKKSVAVDLKTKAGQEVLHRLVARADIFVEQFRAGVAAKLGADYATLRAVNPRLVYCAFEGFGLNGPYAGRPAHDLVLREELVVQRAHVGAHRNAGHRLHAACDRDIGRSREDLHGREVHGLLARPALPVDARPGDGLREARDEGRDPGDVRALLVRLGDASEDDVLDERGLDSRPFHDRPQHVGREVVRADVLEGPAASPDRGPHSVNDHRTRHGESPVNQMRDASY